MGLKDYSALFVVFGFEGQKLEALLENKMHLKSKLWNYVNNKSLAPFFIFFVLEEFHGFLT
jgi:intracellular septation protein A